MIGGRGSSPGTQTRSILAISPTGAVSSVGQLPSPASDATVVSGAGRLLLAGGQDSGGAPQSSILAMNVSR